MWVDVFIRRPVLSTVLALLIVIGGAISIPTLPIARFPELAAPQVNVTTTYTGAASDVVEAAVTSPLEVAINGVEGMRYMQSTSTSNGISTIQVTFEPERDLDLAAVDVINRVQQALPQLPAEARATGTVVQKSSTSIVLALAFYAEDGLYSTTFISNYVDRYVYDALRRVPGISEVRVFNPRKYAMRIWLDPDALAARQLAASDVIAALQEQNLEIPAGQIGGPPAPPGQQLELSVRVEGRLPDATAFAQMILKTGPDGTIVRLGDVGRVELGAQDYSASLRFNGHDAIGVGIFQLPSANALDIDRSVRAVLAELARGFPPGLRYEVGFDPTSSVRESIAEVLETLIIAILIVIAVIFMFLHGWRATVIPAITIPVSLVGAFIFVKLFGFSINTLTLFGLTLATGLVVDDAIVVIENIERHVEEREATAAAAASGAMREVTGAVVATSLVLIAVFVPVSFFPGTTGRIYQQFSLTIAFSIALSAFNALTLSPALAARLLRRRTAPKSRVFRAVDRAMGWTHDRYGGVLRRVLRRAPLVIGLFLLALLATGLTYRAAPTGFVPEEDQGYLIIAVQAPSGSSLEHTIEITKQVERIAAQHPEIDKVFNVGGFSFTGTGSNKATVFLALKPFAERAGPEHSAGALLAALRGPFAQIQGALVIPFLPPSIQGVGVFGGFQLEIQDRSNGPIAELAKATGEVVAAAAKEPAVTGALTQFTIDDPQLHLAIDRDRARSLGVRISEVAATLSAEIGSLYVNDFDFNQRSYRVYVQADKQFRALPSQLRALYVRSTSGAMVALDEIVRVESTTAPQVISHFNLFRSAEITGSAAPGVSSGAVLEVMQRLCDRTLPEGMAYEWAGLSLEQKRAGGQVFVIFGLAVLIVYLVLAAQYESFALPLIILLAVPLAILGALLLLLARGIVNDVFAQIGMVMLVGLASKNAILIVEFAEQLRGGGRSIRDAAIEAAQIRLRPILMTSFAFILGVLPLVVATGSGAAGRRALGTTVFGGMIVSTFLNLLVIPTLYVVIEGWRERRSARRSSRRGGGPAEARVVDRDGDRGDRE